MFDFRSDDCRAGLPQQHVVRGLHSRGSADVSLLAVFTGQRPTRRLGELLPLVAGRHRSRSYRHQTDPDRRGAGNVSGHHRHRLAGFNKPP